MKIATLGPPGTFSEQAAQHIRRHYGDSSAELVLLSHIQRCLQAVPDHADIAVVPIENVSEGFVPVVLDHLVNADLHIQQQIHLPISFSACAQAADINDIKRLYVQFVARGQCRDFIDSLGDIEITPTESNMESLQLAGQNGLGAAAIIPTHVLEQVPEHFNLRVSKVHDYEHNETRFVVLAKGPVPSDASGQQTSLMVINHDDRPGLLEKVLHCFSTRKLNLSSIVSRPTGQGFGRYHFFIDVQSDLNNIAMQGALQAVGRISEVKVLGCY